MQCVSWPKGRSLPYIPPSDFLPRQSVTFSGGTFQRRDFPHSNSKSLFSTVPYGLTPFRPRASLKCQTCRRYCHDRSLASHLHHYPLKKKKKKRKVTCRMIWMSWCSSSLMLQTHRSSCCALFFNGLSLFIDVFLCSSLQYFRNNPSLFIL